jgi:type I restriction enzyme M protein
VNDAGKINAASLKARLKQASDAEEKAALKTAIKFFDEESRAKKALKEAQEALDLAVLARYPKLTESEIKQLLVEDKWKASLQGAIEAEIERITQQLANRVKELEERYSATLPQLTQQVADLETRVAEHLKSMGLEWA